MSIVYWIIYSSFSPSQKKEVDNRYLCKISLTRETKKGLESWSKNEVASVVGNHSRNNTLKLVNQESAPSSLWKIYSIELLNIGICDNWIFFTTFLSLLLKVSNSFVLVLPRNEVHEFLVERRKPKEKVEICWKLEGKNLCNRKCSWAFKTSQPAFTCSKLTIETLQQGMKYVQS